MPRYLRVADVPAILGELKEEGSSSAPYQLDVWQKKWCEFTSKPEEDAAVLSYRWRIRGGLENIKDYKTWLSDCGREGYAVHSLEDGPVPVDWFLADGHALQIEVAAWLLWLHTNQVAKYAWVDQMCVPQDVDIEEKMGHIKDSPGIYKAGKVFVLIAPVVDYRTGKIMNAQEARSIVKMYNDEMDSYRSARFLSRSAVKALLVNNSYMRRVWTIQEAVAAADLTVWPLEGRGEVNSYQSIYVVDWPEFNAWNGHPQLGDLYLKFGDEALGDYLEGDYTGVIGHLRAKSPDAIAYLAMISKDLMWITMDRNGLVNDLKKADSAARRAFVVLNNHQVQNARAFLAEDRVLALVPLVDYPAWREATQGVPGRQMVQASVDWAYGIMEREMASWKWSIRIYNSPSCTSRGLELLQPRRNLGNSSSFHGATPDWSVQIPPEGGTLALAAPSEHPDPAITAFLAAGGHLSAARRDLRVIAAVIMPHPGQAKYWGGGPWTHIRDVLQTDEVFRLSVQWALEPWRNPALGMEVERCAVVVVDGGGLNHPAMMIVALVEGGGEVPSTGQVMIVVDVSRDMLPALLDGLRSKAQGNLTAPFTAVSAGVVPPPPEPLCEPAASEPDWTVVTVPTPPAPAPQQLSYEDELPAEPAVETGMEAAEPTMVGAAAGGSRKGSAASSRWHSSRPGSATAAAAAAPQRPSSAAPSADRPASARPASAAAVQSSGGQPPSARPSPRAAAAAAATSAAPEPPAGASIQKGGEGGVPNSGVEVAAGARYAGRAPVVQGDEGPCKGCVVS